MNVKQYSQTVFVVDHELAELWVAKNVEAHVDYYYGGTRTVDYRYNDDEVYYVINYLQCFESGLKNTLINKAIEDGVFDHLVDIIPTGFIGSKVGGGRCVIKPKSAEMADIISDIHHPRHNSVIDSLFSSLGEFLNSMNGEIKLTPDFGRFAGLADNLNKFTNNVLGIACENGGCGGKASYTSTGIIRAIKSLGFEDRKETPVTLIGSEGACGIGVLNYLLENGYSNIAVCDLAYDFPDKYNNLATPPANVLHLKSEKGKFTDECLNREGLIIAATIGGELYNSNWSLLKENVVFLLAHNEAIPQGKLGIDLIDSITNNKNITIIPGQFLTFGGAITSRVEWFWRNANPGVYFNKPLAHEVVSLATDYWIKKIAVEAKTQKNLYKYLYGFLINASIIDEEEDSWMSACALSVQEN